MRPAHQRNYMSNDEIAEMFDREMARLAQAMNDARARTGDDELAHSVEGGKYRLMHVIYDGAGNSRVEYLSEPRPLAEHIRLLESWGENPDTA